MTYKLVDYKSELEHDVEFGTCEYCFSIGDLEREFLIFEDEHGERFEWENGCWNWGDYDTYLYIENIIDFAYYIDKTGLEAIDDETILKKADEYLEWRRVKNLSPYQKALEDLGYKHSNIQEKDYFDKGSVMLVVDEDWVIKYRINAFAEHDYPEKITRDEWEAISLRWLDDN